jgi:hypothetical protein
MSKYRYNKGLIMAKTILGKLAGNAVAGAATLHAIGAHAQTMTEPGTSRLAYYAPALLDNLATVSPAVAAGGAALGLAIGVGNRLYDMHLEGEAQKQQAAVVARRENHKARVAANVESRNASLNPKILGSYKPAPNYKSPK